ncbi:MAG: cyclic nucleotide-binding domain-containing protein [Comamonadaceae bacterium]|nr:cyclic nucleotide-binding domain-containing protein [Comamonadaceae bacterium]
MLEEGIQHRSYRGSAGGAGQPGARAANAEATAPGAHQRASVAKRDSAIRRRSANHDISTPLIERSSAHRQREPHLPAMNTTRSTFPPFSRRLPHAAGGQSGADRASAPDTTREKRLQKGEMLFQKGDPPKGFYVVVFGQIKLAFSSAQGNEKVVDILGPQQTFGEAVMFMDRPYPVFAQALADTLLLHVSRNAVFELLERDALLRAPHARRPVDAPARSGAGRRVAARCAPAPSG